MQCRLREVNRGKDANKTKQTVSQAHKSKKRPRGDTLEDGSFYSFQQRPVLHYHPDHGYVYVAIEAGLQLLILLLWSPELILDACCHS